MRPESRRSYAAHAVPGLEDIAAEELARCLPGVRVLERVSGFDERTGLVTFSTGGPVASLLQLRTVEDLFALLLDGLDIPSSRAGLHAARQLILGVRGLEQAIALRQSLAPAGRRATFRVVARKAGNHAFRRVDLQDAVEQALLARLPRWRLSPDEAPVEFWATLVDARLWLGLRLSEAALRQRTYRRVSLPASLKPTIAAAMVWLSEPVHDDVFLDPMCGAGTILIERALSGRYGTLLGGDISAEAVAATLENAGPRYKPIQIRRWDARRLPLDDASVSVIATNPPFGRQLGSHEANLSLYPALFAEWLRVLGPGGRLVCLTSEHGLIRRLTFRDPRLRLRRQVPLVARGFGATIYAFTRQP